MQDERRRLLGRVLQAAEDERTRIAHDLHDGPVQQLAVLNYDVYRARKRLADVLGRSGSETLMGDLQGADEVLEGVEKGLGEETRVLRHLMSSLRPPVLDNRGLADALEEHVQRFEQEHAVAVDIHLGFDGRLAPEGVGFEAGDAARLLGEGHLVAEHPMVDSVVDQIDGRMIWIGDHWLADFASCNYLGFDLDPEIIAGVPPTWTPGESIRAELLGVADVLAFPTLTHIHNGVLSALAGQGPCWSTGGPTGPSTTRP